MSRVAVNASRTGLIVSGEIRFSNVLRLRRHGHRFIKTMAHSMIEIDLSQVVSSDASGLSLMLRWMHYANKQGKQVHYSAIPPSLLKVAGVCGVAKLIGE